MAWRRFLSWGTAAAALVVVAPWALAQTSTTLSFVPDSGQAGSATLATGSGYLPSGVVFRWSDGSAIGAVTADRSGSFSNVSLSVPATASPGSHTVSACQADPASGGEACPGSAEFQVTLPPTTTTTSTTTTTTAPPTTTTTTAPPTTTTTTAPPTATTPPIFGADIPDWPDDFDIAIPPPGPDPGPGPSIAVPTTVPPPPDDLAVPLPDVFPDLVALRIEVTQGIQNIDNQMPLVSKRRTYVRVYVGIDGAATWPAYGALEVKRNGQVLGYRWPEGGAIVAKADGGDRAELDDSLYFYIPDAWADGTVRFRTFIYSYQTETPFTKEPWSFNNFQQETVVFQTGQPAMLHLVPLHLHRSYHPSDVPRVYKPDLGGGGDQIALEPQPSNTIYSINGMYRFHPIANLGYQLEENSFYREPFPTQHLAGAEWNLGPCQTTLDHFFPLGNYYLPDFEVLYEDDPGDLGEGNNKVLFEPDYRTIYALDRSITNLKHYIELDEDGGFRTFGDDNGVGPAPLPQTPVFIGGCKSSGYSAPNTHMGYFRFFEDWDDEREFFLGMVDPSLPTFFGGLATGSADAAWVKLSNSFSDWDHSSAGTVGHEIGHLAGLKHVPCRDSDEDGEPDELIGGSIDQSHPAGAAFPDCSLADIDSEGFYGLDVYWKLWGLEGPTVLSNDPGADQTAFPFMGYRSPGWNDPYHYCILLDYYGIPCDPADIGVPGLEGDGGGGGGGGAPEDEPVQPGDPVAFIGGRFDALTGAITIDQVFGLGPATGHVADRVTSQAIEPTPFPFSVVAVGRGGEEIYVDRQGRSDSGHDGETVLDWGSVIPVTGVVRVEIRADDSTVLGSVEVSPNPPTVGPTSLPPPGSGEGSFRFTAIDTDGDPLLASLLYSPDGEHWEIVIPYMPTDHFEIDDLAGLPGSREGRFMIRVTDGFNVGESVTGAVYQIPNNAPVVDILVPLSTSVVALGSEVSFTGSAFDLEDRLLPDPSFRWTSSIDGDLGIGPSFSLVGLSEGAHAITLAVTDNEGATGQALVVFTVDPDTVQVLPGESWMQAVSLAFENEPDDGATTTTTVRATGPDDVAAPPPAETESVIPELAGIVVLCALAGMALWWQKSRAKPRFPWMRDD